MPKPRPIHVSRPLILEEIVSHGVGMESVSTYIATRDSTVNTFVLGKGN